LRVYHDIKALNLGAKNDKAPLVVLGYGNFVFKIGEELKQICPVRVFPLPTHIDFYVWTGDPDLITVENMARVYHDLIVKQVPDRKIILAGYSFYGLLAFEVAQQLKGAGMEVQFIILLDTWLQRVPDVSLWKRMIYFFLEGKPIMAFRHLLLSLNATSVTNHTNTPHNQLNMGQWAEWAGADRFIEWKVCGNEIMKMRTIAQHRYFIKPLYCKGILIRAHPTKDDILRRVLKDFGWNRYFEGGLDIVETNGDHSTILDAPNMLMLAKKIREILTVNLPAIADI
jgi:acetoacetyl-CoA synthetase